MGFTGKKAVDSNWDADRLTKLNMTYRKYGAIFETLLNVGTLISEK